MNTNLSIQPNGMLQFRVRDAETAGVIHKNIPGVTILANDGDCPVVEAPVTDGALRIVTRLGISPAVREGLLRYGWPGRFKPFEHQMRTAVFLVSNHRAFVLNDIGTGKTMASLWAADYLLSRGVIRRVLVLAPLSTLECVWGDSLFMNIPDRKAVVLHAHKTKRRKLAKESADFYILNHDGFRIVDDCLSDEIDLVIIDEVAVYRNAQTKRFKALHSWIRSRPLMWVWAMTGTPTPNAPTDAWAQAKLLCVPKLPRSFTRFKDQTMIRVSQWKWRPKADAEKKVMSVLTPAVRFSRSECLDLPATVFAERHVEMSARQKKLYKDMLDKAVVRLEHEGAVTAPNAAVLMSKLLQISAGAVYNDAGEIVRFEDEARVKEVTSLIEQDGGKVLVFASYKSVVNNLAVELSKHFTVGCINGDTPQRDRTKTFRDFQIAEDPRVIVAHPGTMAHGLTLTRARTIIWHSPVNSNETYMQANGRIERPGKEGSGTVITIYGSNAEKRTYKALRDGVNSQQVLLDLLEEKTR